MKRTSLESILAQICLFICFSQGALAITDAPTEAKKSDITKKAMALSVPFIENKGQVGNSDVLYYAKTFGGTVFIEKSGILTYSMPGKNNNEAAFKEIFADTPITVSGIEPSTTKINYFRGSEPDTWKTDVSTYEQVSMGEIKPGIKLRIKAYRSNIEKIFIVQPDAYPGQIKVRLSGTHGLNVNDRGELEVATELGNITFSKPIAYQELQGRIQPVEIAYTVQREDIYSFVVGAYDNEKPLIIDPLLASTFIGGTDEDGPSSIATDLDGNIYIAGTTYSLDYPTTTGAYSITNKRLPYDFFISKFDSTLTTLLASTFIGGNDQDSNPTIKVDNSGKVYLAGWSGSSDYPTTAGAYDRTRNGSTQCDVVISILDSNLSTLLASTFIGGTSDDYLSSMSVDNNGNIFITGSTLSSNFPTIAGSYDRSFNGGSRDVFVSKLNNSLTTLLAGTFLGGSDSEYPSSIVLDSNQNVYITGYTYSSNFQTTTGAYDRTFNGGSDIFISKLNNGLSVLLSSTFIGGTSSDNGYSILLDKDENVYIAGRSNSTNYPTASNAYCRTNKGDRDVVISKFDNNLSMLQSSTYIGGTLAEETVIMLLDKYAHLYVASYTSSSDYPVTKGAYNESYNGGRYDVALSKFDNNLSLLLTSTFFGGSDYDLVSDICFDNNGNILFAGKTWSSNFPVTSNAYSNRIKGSSDVFISELEVCPIIVTPIQYDFGTLAVSWLKAQSFTVQNISTTNVTLGTLSIAGSSVSEYSILNDTCSGSVLAPDETRTFDVVFTAANLGSTSATVNIPITIPSSDPLTISLNALVTQPCECDLNHDGRCDMRDWLQFGKDWGRTNCVLENPCTCNLNGDGRCDMRDWLLFGKNWGRTDCPMP